jgi:curved DNA-binding protein CbpA
VLLASIRPARHIIAVRKIESISIGPSRQPAARACNRPGCSAPGDHRAPRSRDRLGEFFWFCLDHVREYNKSWNYCSGMSERQIEQEIRQDTVWRRPTWPLGTNAAAAKRKFERAWYGHGFGFRDDLEGHENRPAPETPRGTPEQEALRRMELAPPVSLTQLKARYKELVKQLHPDATGGDRSAEERLKDINDAYTTLRRFLTA